MDESFALFQFAVDNAPSVERSVNLIIAKIPTHPDWILTYLGTTSHNGILYGFLLEAMKSVGTEEDLVQFRDFLHASRVVPDRWLQKAACDLLCPAILATLLEVPGALAAVDDWILLYVYEVPELWAVFMRFIEASSKDS